MSLDAFDLSGLVPAAQPPEDIVISDRYGPPDDESRPTQPLRCAICGTPETAAWNLPIGYANPVCRDCDELAVNDAGADPWMGWRPGEEPAPEPGVIQLAPDDGENPVYIVGAKCWRRYRFGGYITRRDAFDCDSIYEFTEKHRGEPGWIHAFNTPQPDGVNVSRETHGGSSSQSSTLEKLVRLARATTLHPSTQRFRELQMRVDQLEKSLQTPLPDPDEGTSTEYAEAVMQAAKRKRQCLELCERYYRDD